MIDDALLRFSDTPQTITTSAYSTNTIDLLAHRDIGAGRQLRAQFYVNATFAGATSLQILVLAHRTAVVATDVAALEFAVVGSSEIFALSPINYLTVGKQFGVTLNDIPQAKLDTFSTGYSTNYAGLRYLTVTYAVNGTFTAGQLTGGLVLQSSDQKRVYSASTTMI